MFTAGVLALFLGDAPLARRRLDQCVALCEELGGDIGAARARIYLGMAMARDDAVGARVVQDQALAVLCQRGETAWAALALLGAGVRAVTTNELVAARTLCEESLTLFRQLDVYWARGCCTRAGALAAPRASPRQRLPRAHQPFVWARGR